MSDIRLVALGPPCSGKTSIIKRFLFNTFSDKYKPTIEDLFSKEFILNGVKIKVDILDTAGRVEFPAMRRLCISNASAFLFVYSLDPNATYGIGGATGGRDFTEVRDCFEEVKGIRGHAALAGLPIVFVGNKLDLICRQELAVGTASKGSRSGSGGGSGGDISTRSSEFPASLVGDTGFTLDWIEGIEDMHIASTTCSAKTNTNIQQVFTSFLHLYKQITEVSTSSFKRRSSSKSSKNTLQTEEPKSRRSRSLIRRSSRKVKQQVEFIEPECRMA